MRKNIFQKLIPDEKKLRESRALNACLAFTRRAHVWHFNRRSAARAALIGLFCAFIPLPVQMFIAIALCIWCRAHLPLAIGIVWLTNPITMAPVFLSTYHFGAFLLNQPTVGFEFEMNWEWVEAQFEVIWQPLLLGSLVTGAIFACIGYTVIEVTWRYQAIKRWRLRQKRKQKDEK
jgi:hypothetical protein